MFDKIIELIKQEYSGDQSVNLHQPHFGGNEKKYLLDTIDSGFVSSVGEYVNLFEDLLAKKLNVKHAIATVNGTAALHVSYLVAGVEPGDEVITQAMTFVATANSIKYCGAEPIFLDICRESLSLCPLKLESFLKNNTYTGSDGYCYNKVSQRRIKACVPMHTFGLPGHIDEIVEICAKYNLIVVEDAAESLMSQYKGHYTGTIAKLGVFSFNGNKIITTGGGGAIVTNCDKIAKLAKHLTTTAKINSGYESFHDEIGYNYRLPNLNAALGLAQLEQIDLFVEKKRSLATRYKKLFETMDAYNFVSEMDNTESNYWLNAVICRDFDSRQEFLRSLNQNKILVRPVWKLLNSLEIYKHCQTGDLSNAEDLQNRIVNIPSSVV
ncbi:MAG: LegC family aminotransferase [Candidatus Cloacimonetes bacterium]|nr:LegC family aminotransferase [Candidatus Cloacimonadota bacterium]